METKKFEKLIQSITGRNFIIQTTDETIQFEKEYQISKTLPVSKRIISFTWRTPKATDKMLRSFITTFTTKYKEPNPVNYDGKYFGSVKWEDKSEKDKEFCYYHHSSNMFSKKQLIEQIENNFEKNEITNILCQYGFYHTEYGIGIFSFYATKAVLNAIEKMHEYLNQKNIPFKNEFSDAQWVFRFKLNLEKSMHEKILINFNQ